MVGLLPLIVLVVVAAGVAVWWAAGRVLRAARDRRPPALPEIGALLAGLTVLSWVGAVLFQILRSGLHSSRPAGQLLLEQALAFDVVVVGPATALLLLRAHLASRPGGEVPERARARRRRVAVLAGGAWLASCLVLLGWSGSWPPLGWAVRDGRLGMARWLLAVGADPDARERWTGRPLLHAAVLRRDLAMTGLLIEAGADLEARDPPGDTALVVACWQGDQRLVTLLLDHGARLEVIDRGGQSPLMIAATRGDPELARLLVARSPRPPQPLERALVEALEGGEREAMWEAFRRLARRNALSAAEWGRELREAARRGDVDGIGEALSAGAAVDDADERGVTPLLLACRAGASEAVRALLDAGAAVDLGDAGGDTALVDAAAGGRPEVAELLLDHGAAVDRPDGRGRTALMAAAAKGDTAMLELLLRHGADAAVVDPDGDTARSLARRHGGAAAESFLAARGAPDRAVLDGADGPPFADRRRLLDGRASGDRLELLRAVEAGDAAAVARLIRAGADVNGHDAATGGGTALTWAAYCDRPQIVRLLLDLGARVDDPSDAGVTALMEAAKAGSAPVVAALLDGGADPEARTRAGWTALLWASEAGHADVVRLLLARGASPGVADARGRTPLAVARAGGHEAVAQLLTEPREPE